MTREVCVYRGSDLMRWGQGAMELSNLNSRRPALQYRGSNAFWEGLGCMCVRWGL